MDEHPEKIVIPMPKVPPMGIPITQGMVEDVWDVFVKEQEQGLPPSGEMRCLMAVLRAVYQGLNEMEDIPLEQT